MTTKKRASKAIEFVLGYEKEQDRKPEDVSANRNHSGYDVKSGNRMIEVKGVGESWQTYNWQSLHKTEVECLKRSPNDFYLYIVKFRDKESDEVVGFYVIPGVELLNETNFHIEVESYGIRPISQRKLSEYSKFAPSGKTPTPTSPS